MSSMQYIEAKVHVVTDSDAAKELVVKAIEDFNGDNWSADEQEVTTTDGEGFSEVEARVSGYGVDSSLAVFEEVASLGNGSFGLVVWESDWGIDGYNCYGDVELVEADSVDEDVVWESEDTLNLSVAMSVEEWQELLECEPDSIADEIESQGEDLLPQFLPEAFLQACEDDGEVEFLYFDVEVNDEEEGDEEDQEVAVLFELDGHDLSHQTFEAMAEALNCNADELPVPGAKILLSLANASEEDGLYENRLFDVDTYSMLVFKSGWGEISDIKVLVPKSKSD